MQPQEHIQDLRSISEAVADYLDRDLFIEEYGPDDYTVNDIITSCYALMFADLEEIGIHPTKDIDDILQDFYICKEYYYLLKTFRPDTLLSLLKTPEIVEKIESSLEHADNFFIQSLIDIFNEAYPDSYELKELLFIQDELVNDDVFLTYMGNVCKKLQQGDYLIPTPSAKLAQQYLFYMSCKRRFARDSILRCLRYPPIEGKMNMEYITKALRDYDLDKVSPENLALYSKLDNPDVKLPDALKPIAQAANDAHHKRTLHHIEYWIANKATFIPREAILLIVASLFEMEDWGMDADENRYPNAIKHMIKQAGSMLTEEDIKFIWAIAPYPKDRSIDVTD